MTIFQRLDKILEGVAKPTVIECGACDGYHSNLMVQAIKKVDRPYIFHCFEPCDDLHMRIISNLHGHLMNNKGVIGIFPNAVGAVDGMVTFYKSSGEKKEQGKVVDRYYGSSSIRKPAMVKKSFPDMQFSESTVSVVRLDTHCKTMPRIDFIWADIQGAEVDMIRGGLETLRRTRYLYTEYENAESYEGQIGLQGILDLLPHWEIVEDYGGDVLLRNTRL